MKKDKELGASTDAGEVGTLAVSLPGLATRRVARTTVSPNAAPGLTDGSNMAKAFVTRAVAGTVAERNRLRAESENCKIGQKTSPTCTCGARVAIRASRDTHMFFTIQT